MVNIDHDYFQPTCAEVFLADINQDFWRCQLGFKQNFLIQTKNIKKFELIYPNYAFENDRN